VGKEEGREGREVYLQSRLLKRTVLVARAQTALYLAEQEDKEEEQGLYLRRRRRRRRRPLVNPR
jgi:hypothetical protein